MPDSRLFRLRAEFQKTGRLVLLSHLEVARALERTVRRAGLPFAVSQGFAPHMRIGFGAALPVGVGSVCEMVDIFLTRYLAPSKALTALKEASVADLAFFAGTYVEPQAPAVSVAYPLSTYEAALSEAFDSETPPGVTIPSTITVVRKKREKVFTVSEYLVGKPQFDGDRFVFTLEAKPTGSLRPDVFVSELLKVNHAEAHASPKVLSITRVAQSSRIR